MLAGLITYILLAIYCHDEYTEKVSLERVREICINIRNEMSIYKQVWGTSIFAAISRPIICKFLTGHYCCNLIFQTSVDQAIEHHE